MHDAAPWYENLLVYPIAAICRDHKAELMIATWTKITNGGNFLWVKAQVTLAASCQ